MDNIWTPRRVDPLCRQAQPLTDAEREQLFEGYLERRSAAPGRPPATARMATYMPDQRRARRRARVARITIGVALLAVLAALIAVPFGAALGRFGQ